MITGVTGDTVTNFEAFTEGYLEELDEIAGRHASAYRSDIERIYAEADAALISAGKIITPDHIFYKYTEQQLNRFRQTIVGRVGYDAVYEVYRIEPGALGPPPENLQVGAEYSVHGFLTNGLVCSTLTSANSSRMIDGAVEFAANGWSAKELGYFDSDTFIYAGYKDENCGQCGDHTPHHTFGRVLADGVLEKDQYGDPILYSALDDMITIAGQPDSPNLAA